MCTSALGRRRVTRPAEIGAAMNVQLRELSPISPHSCVSQASYWMPQLINGSAWLEHAPFGFWIVEAPEVSCLVNCGVPV